MKNLTRLTLVILPLLAWLLFACNFTAKKRIVVWSSLRPVERELLKEKLDEFGNRHPDYQFVELFYAPEVLRTNFIISSLAGKGPDLIHAASDNIGPLSELEVIKPLEELFSKEFLDSFITKPFPANTWFKGHLYQIADRVGNHLCLVYNKDIIETPPETMSALIALRDEIIDNSQRKEKGVRYVLAWNYTEPFFAVPFIGGFGGWILDKSNSPNLDSGPVIQAAQFIYDLAHKYKVIPEECDYETANALFLDGQSAMIINGPWSWGTYINNGMNIGLARIPKIDETGLWPTPLVSPLGYLVNINTKGKQLDIVVELIHYLTSPEVENQFTEEFAIIPSRKILFDSPQFQENELLKAALDQMMVGRPMPVITEMRWIWDAMRPAYQGIFTGAYTPRQAAREMQLLAEKLIRENRG
ncbi:MAG: extracellular solute-binding protein [Calditrichia bacterium]